MCVGGVGGREVSEGVRDKIGRNKRITAKSESSGLRGSLQSGAERGDNFQEQRGASPAAR